MIKKNEAIILGIILLGLSIFVYFKDPFYGPILPCIFNKITGLYCPGCGMTRAVNSCFKFNFYHAFRFNALIFIMPVMFGAYYVAKLRKKPKVATIIMVIMIATALGFGIIRNLPSFEFLAPIRYETSLLGLLNNIKF